MTASTVIQPNAFTHRVMPIAPFDHRGKVRVLRALPAKPHPLAHIQIEPAAAAKEAAVRRFAMRKAAI